ncbi:hypothetical protein P154DRAFT_30744 [Amniculicola lignicola CBS 123094]|uniref:Uncharacterized protein n=1 Tax=Amniculicola lignicola CBS 123094 TaxID=1392246 RepID=A0A6A5VXL5_9PLEO|nr:hypothetical protein P154DRAFT_30744 [Amniculicola lignicola CBS 123094]
MAYTDLATQAQVVALKIKGVTTKEIEEITGVNPRTQRKMVEKAKERRYVSGPLLTKYLEDSKKSRRPTKRTLEFNKKLAEKYSDHLRSKTSVV